MGGCYAPLPLGGCHPPLQIIWWKMPILSANKLITVTFDSASEVVEADVSTMLRLGQQALAKRNWRLARGYFKKLLELQPDHEDALFHLAALAANAEQTLAYLRRILDHNPQHDRARVAFWRTKQLQAQQIEAARDPVAVVAEQIARSYADVAAWTVADEVAQAEELAARPPLPLPAATLLRVASVKGNWAQAADIICGSGVHPDEMRHLKVEPALAERVRCELAKQRRYRRVGVHWQAARAYCAQQQWGKAATQLSYARRFLLPADEVSARMQHLIDELERTIVDERSKVGPGVRRGRK